MKQSQKIHLTTAFLVTFLLAACAKGELASTTSQTPPPLIAACLEGDECVVGEPFEQGKSLSGNFLAGRHAQAIRNMGRAADYLGVALNIAPNAPDLLHRTFILMTIEGRMDEAVLLARRVIEVNKKSLIANILLAVNDFKNGRYKQSEERLAAIPKTSINLYIAPTLSAWGRLGQKKPVKNATEALKSLDTKNGSKALHNLHFALINDLTGNTDVAVKKFMEAITNQGGLSLRLAQLFGNLLVRADKLDEAKSLYNKYLKENPNSRIINHAMKQAKSGVVPPSKIANVVGGAAEALFGIASSLSQQNIRETALVLGRMALHLKPNFPVMQILIADILESEGRMEKANEIYKTIDPDSPFSWSARMGYAANLDAMDQTDIAIKQLREMAAAEPNQVDPLINLGNILSRHERFKEAVKAYDQALVRVGKPNVKHWSLFYSRGIALERSKQWPRAEADFLKALEFKPNQPFVLNYLGYSWVDQGLNLDRAKKMIRKAVKLRPTDGYIVDSLGWVLYRLGDYKEAVQELERAAELKPQDPVINDHLGDTYWKVGRRQEARFQWRRALSLNPDAKLRAIIDTKIKKGLADDAGGDI